MNYIISRREYSASNVSDTIPFASAHLKLIIMENKVFSSFVTLGKHLSYSLAKLRGILFFFFFVNYFSCTGTLLLWAGFSLKWLLLLQRIGSGHAHFSSCGAWAKLPCSMWNLPGPGIEPMSFALEGGFLTTGPRGKSEGNSCLECLHLIFVTYVEKNVVKFYTETQVIRSGLQSSLLLRAKD